MLILHAAPPKDEEVEDDKDDGDGTTHPEPTS